MDAFIFDAFLKSLLYAFIEYKPFLTSYIANCTIYTKNKVHMAMCTFNETCVNVF